MGEFIAFKATLALHKERKTEHVIEEVYQKCKKSEELSNEESVNHVKGFYKPFTPDEISKKVAEIVRPKEIFSEVEVIYQTIEGLHNACPNHKGDWYFTGDYPTKGGNKVANRAFINFVEGLDIRAY
jgi:amidophosphoribosyltransferase